MICAFSREALALYVGGDLGDSSARSTETHLMDCAECRLFCEQLDDSQSALKSLRKTTASAAHAVAVRQAVLSRIDSTRDILGWALRIERFVFIQLLRRPYAYAAAVVLIAVSISLLAQMRPGAASGAATAAMFDSEDRLTRPANYRQWMLVSGSIDAERAAVVEHVSIRGGQVLPSVYVEPSAYRIFQSTGNFPEGAVIVLELATADRGVGELQVSVKDSSRFAGGWGYFGFADADETTRLKVQAFADSKGCRGCHEARAETDHVFTQFYPMLKISRG